MCSRNRPIVDRFSVCFYCTERTNRIGVPTSKSTDRFAEVRACRLLLLGRKTCRESIVRIVKYMAKKGGLNEIFAV